MCKAYVFGIHRFHVEAWFLMSAMLLEFEEGLAIELCSFRGHRMRSGGQGTGAGCAMKVGISSPGINTETPLAYTVICKFLKREHMSVDFELQEIASREPISCPRRRMFRIEKDKNQSTIVNRDIPRIFELAASIIRP